VPLQIGQRRRTDIALRKEPAEAARPNPGPSGFSLIEVVIVVVILAVIAAIAIPRISRGSQGSIDAALARDVQVLQKAIDLYAAEHNGAFPNGAMVGDQLTLYTDSSGVMSKSKSPPYNLGPYLRKVPPVPSGPNKGSAHISTAAGVGVGWIYDPAEGTILPNTSLVPATSAPSESTSTTSSN
jgi:prepilin-type N-terminal cleavage/methylation domain-containing protein